MPFVTTTLDLGRRHVVSFRTLGLVVSFLWMDNRYLINKRWDLNRFCVSLPDVSEFSDSK